MSHPLVELRWAAKAFLLPPSVAQFQIRARRLARRTGDEFSLSSATRPLDLRRLLGLASGAETVVELGTATGWTAISLALVSHRRQVITYDLYDRPEPRRYLELVGRSVRERIELVVAPGSDGPRNDRPIDLLYIDSSHDRGQTIAEVEAWQPVLAPGALIVFDDYGHPEYRGVAEAIAELELAGERRGTLFVHRAP
jgi:predicted O-methyltransferase YrrM